MARILLLFGNRQNQRMLAEWLAPRYDVLTPDPGAPVEAVLAHEAFDLGIVDGLVLAQSWQAIEACKEAAGNLFMPFLFVTARQEAGLARHHLWRTVDEIIRAPLDRLELQARVEILLRGRRYAQEADQRYYTLAAKSPVGTAIVQEGRLIYGNPAFYQLAGPPSGEEDALLRDWLHPDDIAALLAAAAEEPPAACEVRLGRIAPLRWVEAHQAPLRYRNRPATLYLFSDLEGRKEAERQLIEAKERAEELSRLKSTMLMNMSHEFRTPLTGIIGFADVLAEDLPDALRPFIHLIGNSGRRLLDTLNSVLSIAQLESGTVVLQPQPLDLAPLVREAAEPFISRAAQQGLALTVAPLPERPVLVSADWSSLHQALMHILTNAVKFTEQGMITLALDVEQDHAVVSVRDTGVGISPAFLPHVFEEFKQESTGLRRRFEGSGLGLTVAHRLVGLMGGRIDVESEKAVGTTFSIRLPLLPTDALDLPSREPSLRHS